MTQKPDIVKMSRDEIEKGIASGKIASGNTIEELLGTKRRILRPQLQQDIEGVEDDLEEDTSFQK